MPEMGMTKIELKLIFDNFDSSNCCKKCRRSFTSYPNPLKQSPKPGDLLPRRRPGGLECSPCVYMMQGSGECEVKNMNGAQAVEKLSNIESFYTYHGQLYAYEDSYRNGANRSNGQKRRALTTTTPYSTTSLLKKSDFPIKNVFFLWENNTFLLDSLIF